MLDHLSIAVDDLSAAALFYDRLLTPLGYRRFSEQTVMIGYAGDPPGSSLWLQKPANGAPATSMAGFHVALAAPTRAAVRAGHAAGLAAGARDQRPPALLPAIHPDYYFAMIQDPHGHWIELVCHSPDDEAEGQAEGPTMPSPHP